MTRLVGASTNRALRAAALGLLAVMALGAPGAQATVINKETFSESFSEDIVDECGRSVHEDFSGSARGHVRVGKGDLLSAFFGHQRFTFTDTFTNPENGRSFTITGKAVFQETKAVPVGGTIFQFTAVEAGTFRLLDSRRNTVLVDHGNIRSTILFDTLGDATPGGLFVALVSETVHGPHPLFALTPEEFCTITDELLGIA